VQYDLGKIEPDGRFRRTGVLAKPPRVLLASVENLRAKHRMEGTRITEYLFEMLDNFPHMGRTYGYQGEHHDQLFDANYKHPRGDDCRRCDSSRVVERPPPEHDGSEIWYGTIGSANKVVKDGRIRDMLRDDIGALCVEMEAAGLMEELPCLVIRGICDYADSHKNKRWQPYAAATAAGYAKELLSVIPAQEVTRMSRAAESLHASRKSSSQFPQ